jgi:uncharacterized protein YggL (DUF469 family)
MTQIDRLLGIMQRLRDPKNGCPWDKEQTFATIAPYTLEETYEVLDAISREDFDDLRGELAFDGSGYLAWEGLICKQEIGQCTEEHQAIVRKWLEDHKCEEVRISELFDVWWD